MKDESTGNRYLRAVGQKGVEGMEWLVKDLHEELKSWGRMGGTAGNIIIKTDGEASIVALRNAVARYHGGVVTPEVPPTGGSQAHRSAEDNGRRMRSLIKAYLDQLEERAKAKLQSTDAILLWLIRWVAMAYSRYKVGADGKTPYERQNGRKCVLEVVPFGELVRYKQLGETAQQRKSLKTSWLECVWLGAPEVRARRWRVRRMERRGLGLYEECQRVSVGAQKLSPRCKAPRRGLALQCQACTFRLLFILKRAIRQGPQWKLRRGRRRRRP